MTKPILSCVVVGFCLFVAAADEPPEQRSNHYAEIRVIDAATGRGIPLVELETVNSLRFVTDNAGRIAFHEPGLMDRELFFTVHTHGYEVKKDGFGIAGYRITPRVGKTAEIRLNRISIAERLCRLTGEGMYRDTVLLGYPPLLTPSRNPGMVAGQDSVQAAIYRGKTYWFWGDTNRMNYALGLYRMAGATTPVFDSTFDPKDGISFDYFVGPSGFARNMMPLPERSEGVVWISGLCVVPDAKGVEKLVGHYSRRKGLVDELEQGIAVFNDERAEFEVARQLPLNEKWRHPGGHPIRYDGDGGKWILFGSPTPNVRVPATLRDVLDPAKYEAFTCASTRNPNEPALAADGKAYWRWQQQLPPLSSNTEHTWVKSKHLKPEHARFCPQDATSPGERVVLHSGSVRWNEYRKQWVMLAGQIGGKSSLLGEVWYSEASSPTGPFSTAVKVATHDRQTFYNVCHHAFLDRDGGRFIHFEGTYTNEFSGNPHRTARYNYNQVLYRLDLDSAALRATNAKVAGDRGGKP